ncbi:MAG: hypothetical protein IPQ24_20735 [Anaeromyxobacter sp.]|nr:hypothetical protein [Anaeromyxobacter sp.]
MVWLSAALLLLLLSVAGYTGNPYWTFQGALAVACIAAVGYGYASTGLVGWRAGVPMFTLIFLTIIPLAEELAGLEAYSTGVLRGEAILALAGGIMTFGLTTLLISSFRRRRRTTSEASQQGPGIRGEKSIMVTFLVLGLWGTGYTVLFGYYAGSDLTQAGVLSGVANALTTFFGAGLAVAWTGALSGRRPTWLRPAGLGTALQMAIGLFSASKGAALFPLLVPLLCYVNVRGRVPWRPVAMVVAVYFVVVFPFTTVWRASMSPYGASRGEFASQGAQVLLAGDWLWDAGLRDQAVRSGSRGLANLYGIIYAETGRSTSLEYGSTYLTALGVIVPRMLWPDKPDLTVGNLVGKKYGIIAQTDDVTGISPTWSGEAVMNYGPAGILFLFLVLAMLAVWVDGPLTRTAGAWLPSWLAPVAIFNQEGLVAGTLLPSLRNALAAVAIVLLVQRLTRGGRRRAEVAARRAVEVAT